MDTNVNTINEERGRFDALTAILLLGVMMAIALPLFMATTKDPKRESCQANMRVIANAAGAWMTRSSEYIDTTKLIDLNDDMGSLPGCPTGGRYSIAVARDREAKKASQRPVPVIKCSTPTHGQFSPKRVGP